MGYIVLAILIGVVFIFLMIDSSKGKSNHQDAIRALNKEDPNDPQVLVALGQQYWSSKNYPAAYSKYSEAAELGNLTAKVNLGAMHKHGQYVPKDFSKAEVLFKEAAEAGNVEGQRMLGMLYASGWGKFTDAKHWLMKASLEGDHAAPWILGSYYEDGEIIDKNIGMACAWYELAARYSINSEYVERAIGLKARFSKEDEIFYRMSIENINSFIVN